VQPTREAKLGAVALDGGDHRGRAAAVHGGAGTCRGEQGRQVGESVLVLGQQGQRVPGGRAEVIDEAMDARVRPPYTTENGRPVVAAARTIARIGVTPMPPARNR